MLLKSGLLWMLLLPLAWSSSAAAKLPFDCSAAHLSELDPVALRRVRNAVFARHGHVFKDPKLAAYFAEKAWYFPHIRPPQGVRPVSSYERPIVLDAEEKDCVARVKALEKTHVRHLDKRVDLDGDGTKEHVEVYFLHGDALRAPHGTPLCESTHTASKRCLTAVVVDDWDALVFPSNRRVTADVVSLHKAKKQTAVIIRIVQQAEEDPATSNLLVHKPGPVRFRFLWQASDYNAGNPKDLVFDGAGGIRLNETDWCQLPLSIRWQLDPQTLEIERVQATKDFSRPPMCAACPFVYRKGPAGFSQVGEILRHVVGADQQRVDTLAVPVAESGTGLVLELREEKPETTYLDAIWLDVDGVRMTPRACQREVERPEFCAADGRFLVLRRGDVQRLEFDAPGGVLSADGFYVFERVADRPKDR